MWKNRIQNLMTLLSKLCVLLISKLVIVGRLFQFTKFQGLGGLELIWLELEGDRLELKCETELTDKFTGLVKQVRQLRARDSISLFCSISARGVSSDNRLTSLFI